MYNIATDRMTVDPRLNADPRVDEAHHMLSPSGFKYPVTGMVREHTGGPQTYSGRTTGESHRHLMITDEEWQAFMDDFQQTLVESTKEAIVVGPLQEGPGEAS